MEIAVGRPFPKGIVDHKSVFVIANDRHNVAETGEIPVDNAGFTFGDRLANVGGAASKGEFISQPIGFCEFKEILRFVTTDAPIVHVSVQLIFKLHGIGFAGDFKIVHNHGKTGDIAGSTGVLRIVELTVVGNAEKFAIRQPKRRDWDRCWDRCWDRLWSYGCWDYGDWVGFRDRGGKRSGFGDWRWDRGGE